MKKIHRYVSLLSALLSLAYSVQTRAQAACQFHEVQQLAPTNEPPGGLIPYRKGALWGYADTTGRVVITPWLTQEPPLFIGGFAQHYPQPYQPGKFIVINAHGEFLQVLPGQVVVPAGRGGGAVRSKAANAGQLYVNEFPQSFWKPEDAPRQWCIDEARKDPTGRRFVREGVDIERQSLADYPEAASLGGGFFRSTKSGSGTFVGRRTVPARHGPADSMVVERFALLNGQGQPITDFRYDWLDAFYDNRALFERAGRIGYLDQQGREVIPPRYQDVYADDFPDSLAGPGASREFDQGVAGVIDDSLRTSLIDTTGRPIVPFRHWLALSGPDEAGYCHTQYRTATGDTITQFVRPDGRLAFRRTFPDATNFWQGRAVVRRGRKFGLIDRRGRLIVPCKYDKLHFTAPGTNFFPDTPNEIRELSLCAFESNYGKFDNPALVDTLYMQVWRKGKSGFVERRTGREIVPPRYQVIEGFRNGFAWVQRDSQQYIIDRHGREIIAAHPDYYFWDWQRRVGRQTYFLLTTEDKIVADTWMLTDTLGRVLIPPQSRGLFPRLVTGGGLVIVERGQWGAIGPGGQVLLPLGRYREIELHDSLVVAPQASANADSTRTIALFNQRGQLLREFPRTHYWYFLPTLKLLSLTQKMADGRLQTQLIDQTGRTRLVPPFHGGTEEINPIAPLAQRRHLLHLRAESDEWGRRPAHGLPGGYMSLSGRRFWED